MIANTLTYMALMEITTTIIEMVIYTKTISMESTLLKSSETVASGTSSPQSVSDSRES